MNILVQDALLINAILYFFGFLGFVSIGKNQYNNNKISFIFLALFFLLNSVGDIGIYFRADITLFASVIISNTLLFLGILFLLIGITSFYRLKLNYILYLTLAFTFVILFLIFTYINPSFKIRVMIFGISQILILIFIISVHFKCTKKLEIEKGALGLTLLVLLFTNVIRVVTAFLPNDSSGFLDYNIDSLNIIVVGIAGNMIALGMLSMINNVISNDLEKLADIFSTSIKNAPTPIMIHSEDGSVLNISKKWTEATKYTIDDIPTVLDWTRKAYGAKKDNVLKFIKKIYTDEKKQHDDEFEVMTKDGRKLTWDFNSGYIGKLPDGKKIAMSVAIDVTERNEREKEIGYLSYHDQLTSLYNRRFFEEELSRLDNPRNFPLSIIMGDVNGLKLINDAFGHEAGDELLMTIGSIIKRNIRSNDIAARWGGDEFAIILPSTNKEDIEIMMKRIHEQLKKASFKYGIVSISFGYASKELLEDDIKTIFGSAEEIMYQNKLEMRDSVRGETINTIMTTLFEKSVEVKNHSERVSILATEIAKYMRLSTRKINDIKTIGMIHDIGKIVIDLTILDKSGKLNSEERALIEQHPLSGSRMLNSVHKYERLAIGVLHHHERIDGKGYPYGLKGEEIPIESRIIAIADAYDAMTSKRAYRGKPLTMEEAVIELVNNKGTQFDAKIVDIFTSKIKEIIKKTPK